MLGIINDILDMSKIESGQTHLHPEPLNLSEQIEQIEMLIRPQAVQKKQTFSIYKDEILHEHIEGDPTKLRQILVNILSNAVKYTPEGGSIDFHIRELPRTLHSYARYQFTIKDNGIGIEADFSSISMNPLYARRIPSPIRCPVPASAWRLLRVLWI